MSNITFQTARGAKIEIKADTLHINGNAHHGGIELAQDAQHGLCIKTYFGGVIVPVPAASQAEVSAYFAERAAAVKAAAQMDREIDRNYNRTLRGMGG